MGWIIAPSSLSAEQPSVRRDAEHTHAHSALVGLPVSWMTVVVLQPIPSPLSAAFHAIQRHCGGWSSRTHKERKVSSYVIILKLPSLEEIFVIYVPLHFIVVSWMSAVLHVRTRVCVHCCNRPVMAHIRPSVSNAINQVSIWASVLHCDVKKIGKA